MYDQARYRQRPGLAHQTHAFAQIARIALEELRLRIDATTGRTACTDYVGCIEKYFLPYFAERQLEETGKPVDLFFTEYTIVGKDGLPVQPGYAAMKTVGIKVRPCDLELSEALAKVEQNKLAREIETEIRSTRLLERKGAVTSDQADRVIDRQQEKRQRLRDGLTVDGDDRK